jgi:hypothetical protein
MKKFDTRTYSVSDFAEWYTSNRLVLSPEFQRRAVWNQMAKSYLIDTVIRGKPMPKVLITQELVDGRNVRTVVDGQQRLRAILEFLQGSFTMSRTHNRAHAGKLFDELPQDMQDEMMQYEVGVDVLFNTELSELLDIFSRLNTYSVKLNTTELLNASHLGAFKTESHRLGHKYAQFLLDAKVVTSASVTRMGEVELLSDLLGATIEGISSKKTIPLFYRRYDEADETVADAAKLIEGAFSRVVEIYAPKELATTNFKRIHLFYSLVLALASIGTGRPAVPGVSTPFDYKPARARVALDGLSADFDDAASSPAEANTEMSKFVTGARRATTDQSVREQRTRFIIERIGVS